jgi:ABC-type amino acid transport substrate-binding protein
MIRFAPLALCLALAMGPASGHDAPSTLERIAKSRTVTLAYAVDALPFSYLDQAKGPSGYTVQLCKRVVAGLQRQLGLDRLEAKWVTGTTAKRIELVAACEADLDCGTTSVNLARQEIVDFSNLIFVESGGIIVRADSGIQRLADLTDKKVAVVAGTTTAQRLHDVLAEKLINTEQLEVAVGDHGFQLLEEGKVDAYAGDRVVLVGKAGLSGHAQDFAMLTEEFSFDPYAIALPRGDADFRLAVNRILAHLYSSGEIMEIFRSTFGTEAMPSPLLQTIYHIYGFQD